MGRKFTAMGKKNTAMGIKLGAMGQKNTATGQKLGAMGKKNRAMGIKSCASIIGIWNIKWPVKADKH